MTARDDLVRALEVLAETVKAASAAVQAEYAPVPEPVKAEQPDRFEHRDIDGDWVLVYPHKYPEFQSLLMVETDGDSVRLSQDAVNGLARYLDRYRTDQSDCDPEEVEQCGGTHDRVSVLRLPTDQFYCAGFLSQVAANSSGCSHPRDRHGAQGCVAALGCPCERRNGL